MVLVEVRHRQHRLQGLARRLAGVGGARGEQALGVQDEPRRAQPPERAARIDEMTSSECGGTCDRRSRIRAS